MNKTVLKIRERPWIKEAGFGDAEDYYRARPQFFVTLHPGYQFATNTLGRMVGVNQQELVFQTAADAEKTTRRKNIIFPKVLP